MSRFGDSEEGMPWNLWDANVSRALAGRRGQAALADLESALLALPETRLIEGNLATDGGVCAVGAFVAAHKAKEQNVDLATVIDGMVAQVRCWCGHGIDLHSSTGCSGKRWQDAPCTCSEFDAEEGDEYETAEAGKRAGLSWTLAWHFAYLNDEEWGRATPEERYKKMLAFARRAQGKDADVAVAR